MIQIVFSLCLLLASASSASAAPQGVTGSWTAYAKQNGSERLQFSMNIDGDGNNGMGFERSDFAGLTPEQVSSAARVPVAFEMRRESGVIAFEGTFRGGRGAGEFTFTPDPVFPQKLERLGVEFTEDRGDLGQQLFTLTLFDVSTEFIRSMQMIGYDVSLDEFVSFRIFGVDPAYVREMASVGFPDLPANELVTTKIHGATPEYIRQMRAEGNDLTLDEYVQARIFQVTPEFADEMKKVGYGDLDHDTLVQFKIHGVTTDFIQDLRKLGYSRLPADQLVAMRVHGVTPEFIKRVEKAGYKNVPIEKLVQMRIFDIDPEMIGALDEKKH